MVFADVLFGAYGIRKPAMGDVGGLKQIVKDQCPAGMSKEECERRLMEGSDGVSMEDDEKRFLAKHIDILRRSRLDTNVSRVKALIAMFKALPTFLRWVLFVCVIIAILIALIPLTVIVITVLAKPWARAKVFIMIGFTLLLMLVYYLIPV